MIYIGIDPGVSGGLAFLDDAGSVLLVARMPATMRDLIDLFNAGDGYPLPTGHRLRAVLERVNAGVFAMGGKRRMGAVSAFTFGRGFGRLEGALAAARVPYDEVAPVKWQTVMGCRTGGDKNISKARAQQLFPDLTVTHAIADALLLAEYGRRIYAGLHRPEEQGHGKVETPEAGEIVEGQRRERPPHESRGSYVGTGGEQTIPGTAAARVAFVRAAQSAAAGHGTGPQRAARSSVRSHR
jgi:crossover junction endodeoxyribonuclease RuvC